MEGVEADDSISSIPSRTYILTRGRSTVKKPQSTNAFAILNNRFKGMAAHLPSRQLFPCDLVALPFAGPVAHVSPPQV